MLTCKFLKYLFWIKEVKSQEVSLQFSALHRKDFDKVEKANWVMRSLNACQMKSLA
jgi:hypothetical protein